MPATLIPALEAARLAELRSYDVLDAACDLSFDNIASLAAQLTDCPVAMVNLIDADRQISISSHGVQLRELPRELSFCTHAIQQPETTMVVPDASRDARFAQNPLVRGAPHIGFYAGVPLVNPQGAALGTLCVADFAPRSMTEAQQGTLRQLAQTVMTTLELRRAMNRIRALSLTDPLTGLANRPALLDALDRAIAQQRRQGTPFALLYLDLDGFKRVNDLEGHATGDAVLRDVASALGPWQQPGNLVARLGGDEFALLLASPPGEATTQPGAAAGPGPAGTAAIGMAAASAGASICAAVSAAPAAQQREVTASVGAVSYLTPPPDLDHALAAADALMYEAKLAGKNRVAHREHAVTTIAPLPA